MSGRVEFSLVPFSKGPETRDFSIRGSLAEKGDGVLVLEMSLEGPLERIKFDEPKDPQWQEGLWEGTCFELFWSRPGQTAYDEWNFAPSSAWAHFRFGDYRQLSSQEKSPPPQSILWRSTNKSLGFVGEVRGSLPLEFATAAVVLHREGLKSYWALTHVRQKPDFHHRGSFVLSLS